MVGNNTTKPFGTLPRATVL